VDVRHQSFADVVSTAKVRTPRWWGLSSSPKSRDAEWRAVLYGDGVRLLVPASTYRPDARQVIGLNECLDRGRRAFSAKVIANEANEYHRIELVYRKAPTTGLSILVK
jgi:hypothetical protein